MKREPVRFIILDNYKNATVRVSVLPGGWEGAKREPLRFYNNI